MDIRFHGSQDCQQATEDLLSIIKLFREKYQIQGFREMHLSVTLLDVEGVDVELVDTDTNEALRVFEVYHQNGDIVSTPRKQRPQLKLVINKEFT